MNATYDKLLMNPTLGQALGWGKVSSSRDLFKGKPDDPQTTKATEAVLDFRNGWLNHELKKLKDRVDALENIASGIANASISSLPSDIYKLRAPLNVIMKVSQDETLALLPELELYGEGVNEMEAIADLKNEFLDLIEDLEDLPEDEMGAGPKSWKSILDTLVEKCQ